jgi:Ni,Fe-hydrogenase III component G
MSVEVLLQQAAELVGPFATETNTPEPNRLDVLIPVENLRDAVQAVQVSGWGYLITITGLDQGVEAGLLELLYHFAAGSAILTLRVRTSRENPTVPSIIDIVPSVSFYERELIEMFGFSIIGTPNTDRLFLPDDWPAGVYPLRKDFKLEDLTM